MMLDPTTHQFEFLTPAWTGGATPSASAEVRVATLRGHLRQWLRILYPGAGRDAAIFGSMAGDGGNTAAVASKVLLQLAKPVQSFATKNLVSYTGAGNEQDALLHPESYFLWPLRTQSRGVLLPGASSDFILRVRWFPMRDPSAADLRRDFGNAVRAFSLLGCIGTRATRGYGSVWEKGKNFDDVEQLQAALQFLPATVKVRLLDGEFNEGRKALAAAARWMRSYRVGSATFGTTTPEAVNDHDVADPAQAARTTATVYRHALGMPLSQRFNRGHHNTQNIQSSHRYDGAKSDRYPSPLRIKVVRMAGNFRVLVVLLHSLLLPAGTRISLSNHPARRAVLSHDLLNRMMRSGTDIH